MNKALMIMILLFTINTFGQDSLCHCDSIYVNQYTRSDLTITNWGNWKDTLDNWLLKNDAKTVKVLELGWFGAIPKELRHFINVETIIFISNGGTIKNLDIFPKLSVLIIQESKVRFTKNSGLDRINYLIASKSEISGLKSFSYMPNLISVNMTYSGFDKFPKDFKTLKNLCSFVTGATTFGQINLDVLDLGLNECLDIVEFHTWNNNISGIPRNIENISSVKIHHQSLSEEEKKKFN